MKISPLRLTVLILLVVILLAFCVYALFAMTEDEPDIAEVPPSTFLESVEEAHDLMAAQSNAIAAAQAEKIELEKQLAEARQESGELKEELGAVEAERAGVRDQRTALQSEVNRLQGEIAAKKALLHVMTNQAEKLEGLMP